MFVDERDPMAPFGYRMYWVFASNKRSTTQREPPMRRLRFLLVAVAVLATALITSPASA